MIEEKTKGASVLKNSPSESPKVFVHMDSVSYSRNSAANKKMSPPCPGPYTIEDLFPPVPPPRQMSLLQDRDQTTDSSTEELPLEIEDDELRLAEHATSEVEPSAVQAEEEEGGGYCDFARYPVLPKEIKLRCSLMTVATRTNSGEERSPKVAPKKPQRHSLPASGLLRKELSEEVSDRVESSGGEGHPHLAEESESSPLEENDVSKGSEEVMTEPSVPLVEKPSWRFPRTIVPFCRKQASRNGRTGNGHRKLTRSGLETKRAKSFSSADLEQAGSRKRSSFRKLLELKASMKMLPKLLAKGSQSLDCTAVETEQCIDGESTEEDLDGTTIMTQQDLVPNSQSKSPGSVRSVEHKPLCPQTSQEQSIDGEEFCAGVESAVEYENVPFYEEIPEYMNLPFLSATGALAHRRACLGWHNSSSVEDGDGNIYEEQEPYVSGVYKR
ncbi:hypothetical protein AGOR_G00180900 [Albula goreensis]|uniref:Uncharacterized protein n=1 Tax=Albula goreensis TaxID=1534307 RepID=A0A8T3CZM8_9TELE|nr:hypothetical protein AGOR_G00180900 [Albula goreensis]